MRILILAQLFHPEPAFKGLPFAKQLMAQGHEVEVLTTFPNYPGGKVYEGYKVSGYQKEVVDGITIHRTWVYPSHDKSGIKRMMTYGSFCISAWLKGVGKVRKPDVVYVYNLVTLAPVYKKLRRKFGCKVVVDVQDLWPESVANSGMLSKRSILDVLTRYSRDAYDAADAIAVLGPGFKKNLADRGIDAKKIEVIYNWAPEGISPMPRDPQLAESLGLNPETFHIMFAGTMGIAQDLDPVLDAAKICAKTHPNICFLFLGGGVDEPRLKQRVLEEKIVNAKFLPRQPMSEMGRVMACADALLVHLKDDPLFRITIPSKTQAYLASGIPVLMAMEGDAADLVVWSGGGIKAEPGNSESIAQAAKQLAELPKETLMAMGAKGRAYYDQELSVEVGAKRFGELFEGLVNKP